MAVTTNQIKSTYPLPAYNYRVEIGATAVAFTEVTGLSVGFEKTTYKESPVERGAAGPRTFHMPAQPTPATVTLKKGVVRGVSVKALYQWINSIQLNLVEKKDVFVRLCDEHGSPVITWKVINAFPTKLDAPSFSATSNDVAVESLELMADGVTVEEA